MAQKLLIKTDKWRIAPQPQQRQYLLYTVAEYRRLCRYLVTVISTHWPDLGSLTADEVIPAVERLIHRTKENPNIKYSQFEQTFWKFPSYYRRAAIAFSVGQVSSFMTRYRDWQCGQSRNRRDAKPPTLNPDTGCYPTLYKGQCFKLIGLEQVEIKVFTGTDWVWENMPIVSLRERHKVSTNVMKSPALVVNERSCHLSVPFHCKPAKVVGEGVVAAVDLGINTTATVSVVRQDGTVIHREFIHPGRDIDRRDKRLKSVSQRAKKTMSKGGKLHKGFCKNTYRKCKNINKQIGHVVSKRITEIAKQYNASAIVFEDLKGWKPKGGKKRSNLKQKFHGWLKALIADLTEDKWRECGGKTVYVVAAYTSKLAHDGSGTVKRDPKNYALSTFASGKRYNADLNGSLNIAARGWQKLASRNGSKGATSRRSGASPRSWVCLCDLWSGKISA